MQSTPSTERTIYQQLMAATSGIDARQAVYYLGKSITYGELKERIERIAAYLKGAGVRRGEAVTICLPNIPGALAALYAINKLGCIANIIHPLVPAKQLIALMEKTESTRVFLLDTTYRKNSVLLERAGFTAYLCGAADDLPALKAVGFQLLNRKELKGIKESARVVRYRTMLKTKPQAFPAADGNRTVSVYLHSGGTTGSPKTVMLSDYALNSLALRGKELVGHKDDDVYGMGMLAVLPLFHGFGLCMCVHTMLANGAVSILVPQFNVKMVTGIFKTGRVQFMAGVPTMYEKLLADKRFVGPWLKNLEFAFCGGDSMPLPLKERFDRVLAANGSRAEMLEGYGLTETVTVCTVNTRTENRPGSMGKPLEGIRVKALEPETGAELPAGVYGELAVCGDTTMLGYLHDGETTSRVLRKDAAGDVWVRTGDLGTVDADGYVWFKQRLKRIIKVSGVAVYPTEIEEAACAVPGVIRACAVSVPNVKTGHMVKLLVQTERPEDATEEMKGKIRAALSETLIRWAVPREIEYLEKMPLTMIGKVNYRELEERENAGNAK